MVSSSGIVSGLDQRTAVGRLYKSGTKKAVLAFPGTTFDKNWWFNLDAVTREIRSITDTFGFPVASIGTLDYWGNSTMRTQISDLRTSMNATLGIDSSNVHLLGVSAGGAAALNWARANPSLVQSIVLLIPALNLQGIWDENRSGFKAAVNAAYGGRPAAANNPLSNLATFNGMPIEIYYSTTDPVTTQAENESFVAGTGAIAQNMGAIGHIWSSPWHENAPGEFFEAND